MMRVFYALAILPAFVCPAAAQDIRGLERCTAEKAMDRRTSCLQSNVEFLQQALDKQARETRLKLDAAAREAASRKAEIAALKSALENVQRELTELKKARTDGKPNKK